MQTHIVVIRPPPGEGDWCGWGDSFNAQKLKINGRSSSGNTLSQHGRLWDLHAIHLSNCIRASGDCCRIGTANFSRRPELFFRRKRRFSRRVGSVFAGGAAAIKTTSTATGLKKKKKRSRWAISRVPHPVLCAPSSSCEREQGCRALLSLKGRKTKKNWTRRWTLNHRQRL